MQEEAEGRRFDAAVGGSYAYARRIGVVAAYFDGAVHMAANIGLIAVLWHGRWVGGCVCVCVCVCKCVCVCVLTRVVVLQQPRGQRQFDCRGPYKLLDVQVCVCV